MRSGKAVRLWVAFCAAMLVGACPCAWGASQTFNILANGIKEVSAGGTPGQGDLDGTAIGTLALDSVAGTATINVTLSNIDLATLSGHHIHQAPATTTGSI